MANISSDSVSLTANGSDDELQSVPAPTRPTMDGENVLSRSGRI